MPQPYSYVVPQADVGSYFDAMRQGRQDRLAVETEQKQNALSKYLPGALSGDKAQQDLALQNAPVDKMAGLKAQFMEMDKPKLEAVKEFRRQGEAGAAWARNPQQWAQVQERQRAEAQRLGIPFAEIPYEQKDAFAAMGRTVDSLINEEIERKKLALDVSRTNAQNTASYASAAASKALAGQRVGGGGKPLPTRVQTAEDDDIQAIQTTQSIGTQIDVVLDQLRTGELELGPVNNAVGGAQNYLGLSTPNSRNLAMFQATLEKLRNDSLRLNKGVQTEGDAVRAWNEVARSINDPKVVGAQLMRVKRLNEIAAKQRQQAINVRRARNGGDPFDFNTIDVAAPAGQPAQPPRAAVPAQGRGPQPGTVEGGFEFQGGDPADPNNWEPVQ